LSVRRPTDLKSIFEGTYPKENKRP